MVNGLIKDKLEREKNRITNIVLSTLFEYLNKKNLLEDFEKFLPDFLTLKSVKIVMQVVDAYKEFKKFEKFKTEEYDKPFGGTVEDYTTFKKKT